MKLVDARSGKIVEIGETVRYPRMVLRPDGSSYEGPNEDWTLLAIHTRPSEGDYVSIIYREDATLALREVRAPVRGWWIWKHAIMPT